MEYSKALDMSYEYFPNLDLIRFEDGVCYTMEEAIIISSMKNDPDVRATHMIKKMFGGKLMRDSEGKTREEQDKSWFELAMPYPGEDPTPVHKKGPKYKEVVPDAEILTLDL